MGIGNRWHSVTGSKSCLITGAAGISQLAVMRVIMAFNDSWLLITSRRSYDVGRPLQNSGWVTCGADGVLTRVRRMAGQYQCRRRAAGCGAACGRAGSAARGSHVCLSGSSFRCLLLENFDVLKQNTHRGCFVRQRDAGRGGGRGAMRSRTQQTALCSTVT